MKGLFLLFTISFLVMIQIQSGILKNLTTPASITHSTPSITKATGYFTSTTPTSSTTSSTSSVKMATRSTTSTTLFTTTSTTSTTTTTTTPFVFVNTARRIKSGAPALSSLGSGSVLVFFTNTLVQLFRLS